MLPGDNASPTALQLVVPVNGPPELAVTQLTPVTPMLSEAVPVKVIVEELVEKVELEVGNPIVTVGNVAS